MRKRRTGEDTDSQLSFLRDSPGSCWRTWTGSPPLLVSWSLHRERKQVRLFVCEQLLFILIIIIIVLLLLPKFFLSLNGLFCSCVLSNGGMLCVCVCVTEQRSEPAALNRRGCGASADEHMAAVTASQLRFNHATPTAPRTQTRRAGGELQGLQGRGVQGPQT